MTICDKSQADLGHLKLLKVTGITFTRTNYETNIFSVRNIFLLLHKSHFEYVLAADKMNSIECLLTVPSKTALLTMYS